MHCQPVYRNGAEVSSSWTSQASQGSSAKFQVSGGFKIIEGPKMVAYVNGVSEALFKVGMRIPAGPYVSDEDVKYIVECIKEAIVK